jgi:ATPase subunit of ABC transporter with duplicated ATPase domains
MSSLLTCKEASVLLSQGQERRLGLRERLVLKIHLLICDGCTNFSRQLALLRDAIRRYRDEG